jgi:hypothetical protein
MFVFHLNRPRADDCDENRMTWILSFSFFLFFLIMVFLLRYFVLLGFPLPIDAFCDCIPARTSIQALGLLYRMAETEVLCDTGIVKVFCCMVQQNVNIRRLDMSRMNNTDDVKSLTNALIMDATNASETIPNLDAKFSFLRYKFCKDGPGPDKARLYSCMPFLYYGILHKDVPVPLYIKGHADGVMQAIQLFLQKYSNMKGRKGWDELAEDVDYVGNIDDLPFFICSTSWMFTYKKAQQWVSLVHMVNIVQAREFWWVIIGRRR